VSAQAERKSKAGSAIYIGDDAPRVVFMLHQTNENYTHNVQISGALILSNRLKFLPVPTPSRRMSTDSVGAPGNIALLSADKEGKWESLPGYLWD